MKILRTFLLSALMPLSFTALALDITNEAGKLAENIGSSTDITTLNISGTINAADFDFISSSLPDLQTLNLSNATVAAYSGERTLAGGTEYPADAIPACALFGSKAAAVTLPAGLQTIEDNAFASSDIASIAIPATVTAIGDNAFAGCKNLTSITIPAAATSLGANLFMGCTKLASAEILAPVAEVGARWFDGCTKLASVTLPATVTSIGEKAFINCSSLSDFTFSDALKSIGAYAFYASGLEEVDLSEATSLTEVGNYAFAKAPHLASASFADRSFDMGVGVFFDDTALIHVTLPASTTVIPAFTFKGTNRLETTSIPSNVRTIDDYALTGWNRVTEFSFPSKLTYLGDGAMEGWSEIRTLNASNLTAVPDLGENVWEGVEQSEVVLYVDTATIHDFENADQWKEFKVRLSTTNSGDLVEFDPTESSNVDFWFEGHLLVISSPSCNIEHIDIYDLQGQHRYTGAVGAQVAKLDTSAWTNMVIVADVHLENGKRATIKLTRN